MCMLLYAAAADVYAPTAAWHTIGATHRDDASCTPGLVARSFWRSTIVDLVIAALAWLVQELCLRCSDGLAVSLHSE